MSQFSTTDGLTVGHRLLPHRDKLFLNPDSLAFIRVKSDSIMVYYIFKQYKVFLKYDYSFNSALQAMVIVVLNLNKNHI